MKDPKMVQIPQTELDEMLARLYFLDCLEGCGVDNWSGYGDAVEMSEEEA